MKVIVKSMNFDFRGGGGLALAIALLAHYGVI